MRLCDAKFVHFKIKIKKDGSGIFIFILPFILSILLCFANLASNQSLYQEWGLDEEGGGRSHKRTKEKKKKGKKKYTRSHTFLMGLL